MSTLLSKPGFSNGIFSNPWPTWQQRLCKAGFLLAITKKAKDDFQGSESIGSFLETNFPILKPIFQCSSVNENTVNALPGIRLTWIGHATTLFCVDGVLVLCDPVFSERCSSVQFMGPMRYRPTPCKIDELPKVDAVVISHNHYDHLDTGSIRQLGFQFPEALFFVPLGCGDFLRSLLPTNDTTPNRVQEATWWEEFPIGQENVKLAFTPTQHWSGRNLVFDYCRSLWGSWAIIGPVHRAWFAGDTGYCSAFQEIGSVYGPFDVAAIPIGAYEPRDVLNFQHVNPSEAVQIHLDVKAKYSVGIHWGTFALGRESYMAPKIDLQEAVLKAGLSESDFRTIKHGQSFCYSREPSEHVAEE